MNANALAGASDASPNVPAPAGLVGELRSLARRGLQRMFRPDERLFVFRLRRAGGVVVSEGLSRRYTAITLIGLAGEDAETVRAVLGSLGPREVCGRLLSDLSTVDNLGEVALTLWAARALGHGDAPRALQRLLEMRPAETVRPTVELAWTLVALSLDAESREADLRAKVAERLLGAFNPRTGLFPHVVGNAGGLRGHVCCFADLVYPIHALSHYYRATREARALEAARRSAEQICRLQGQDGQWWWHYDLRTGDVTEGYPVYAVHQDAMAPMALFSLKEASGADFTPAIARGLAWLAASPELRGGSLVDRDAELIWRKVGRREPGKLSRQVQAVASRLHPALRAPGLDLVFPPRAIDFEDRPYHLGWLLYAFPAGRTSGW